MTDHAPGSGDVVHRLTSSVSALLLGLQRLRKLAQEGDRERVLALVDRLEGTVQGMVEVLEAARPPAPPPPPDPDPDRS